MLKTIQNIISNPLDLGLGLFATTTTVVGPVVDKVGKKIDVDVLNSVYDLVIIPIPGYPITGLHVSFTMGSVAFFIYLRRLDIKRRSEELDLLAKERKFNKKP